jgi:hypothetical protein
MDDAWRRDMDALGAEPPRPAVHKLAILDKVIISFEYILKGLWGVPATLGG